MEPFGAADARPAKQELRVAATYRASDGSCESHLLADEFHNCPIISAQNGQPVSANPGELLPAADETARRRSTLTESLVERLTAGEKNNRLLAHLLAGSLVASVLNTLLLSFIAKSIQLSDKGLLNGKLHRDSDHLAGVVLELPAKLARGTLSVRAIESLGDRALRVQKLPDRRGPVQADDRQPADMPLVAAQQRVGSTLVTGSYIDLRDGALELGASSFTMDQLLVGRPSYSHSHSHSHSHGRLPAGTDGARAAAEAQQVADDEPVRRRLIEFDAERQSITMPLVAELQLSPASSNSISVQGELTTPQLTGSLEEDLDVQTRDGDLNCHGNRRLELVSKSSSVRLASSDSLRLSSALISIGRVAAPDPQHDAQTGGPIQHLYLEGKLEYFDEVEPERLAQEMTQSDGIRAYNLVAINGLLMAA